MSRLILSGWAVLAALIVALTFSLLLDGSREPGQLLPISAASAGTPLPTVVQSTEGLPFSMVVPDTSSSQGIGRSEQIARAAKVGVGPTGVGSARGTNEPKTYIGPNLQLHEAHWQGMDTRKLDRELRRKLKYPRGLRGILVTEVTLNAARSGLLAGDVIVAVEETPVKTLKEFQQATKMVQRLPSAKLQVFRKGKEKEGARYPVSRKRLVLRSGSELGFAQVEGSPMILPGDMRPHPERGPCTSCHAVGKGFELSPDPDLIVLPPPPISSANVAEQARTHGDRGPCTACHVVTR